MRTFLAGAIALAFAVHPAAVRGEGVAAQNSSPDGRWAFAYTRANGYGNLTLINLRSGRRSRMYHSNDSCCDEIYWVRPHLLIFVDDYNVKTLNPDTHRVNRIAGFDNYSLSPDDHWVAGYASCGGLCAEQVDVAPIAGGECRAVPRRSDEDDHGAFFTRDSRSVTVFRQHFDTKLGYAAGPVHELTFRLSSLRLVAHC